MMRGLAMGEPRMGKRTTILLVLILALVVAGTVGYLAYMRPSPSYQNTPLVRKIGELELRLASAASSGRVLVRVLGNVTYGNFSTPMWVVTREPKEPVTCRCFLVGSIHGNEPAGVECLVRFVERLAADANLYPDVAFEIVPLANPWGWAHNRRGNGDGYDLNRDFSSFRTQETRLIGGFLKSKRYELAMDLHEDRGATGFYLYQYAEDDPAPAHALIAAQRANGVPIEQNASMVILKTHDGLIRAPMWTLWCVELVRKLSIGNYLRLENAPRVYTFETPSRLDIERRVGMHETALEHLLARE